jgi:hypothetical protein
VRRDGTLRRPVTIWVVCHGINDQLDAVYRTKNRRYAESIIGHITSPEARATTLNLVPRAQ